MGYRVGGIVSWCSYSAVLIYSGGALDCTVTTVLGFKILRGCRSANVTAHRTTRSPSNSQIHTHSKQQTKVQQNIDKTCNEGEEFYDQTNANKSAPYNQITKPQFSKVRYLRLHNIRQICYLSE
eukprot:TRINITY_DN14399_c0_g1_i1.p2 TRINITY_DN14399_c0_g1~~TRINITY_DN14399_c0_g1_i1.p2  ORF type:complete len:124 (+),score=3.18 TRINITY_DN14399_c0_g1_i1:110-481(+)